MQRCMWLLYLFSVFRPMARATRALLHSRIDISVQPSRVDQQCELARVLGTSLAKTLHTRCLNPLINSSVFISSGTYSICI